jgi:hypothetical protein
VSRPTQQCSPSKVFVHRSSTHITTGSGVASFSENIFARRGIVHADRIGIYHDCVKICYDKIVTNVEPSELSQLSVTMLDVSYP